MLFGDIFTTAIGNAVGFCRTPFLATTAENAFLLLSIGIVLIAIEAKTGAKGILAIIGAVALFLGLRIAIDLTLPAWDLPLYTVAAIYAATFLIALGAAFLVTTLARVKKVTGPEELLSTTGVIESWQGDKGAVRITGETWAAVCADGPLKPGDTVRPVKIDGLVLTVIPVPERTLS